VKDSVVVRRALPEDYAAFTRLFPELLVDDPVPSAEVWGSVLAPTTVVAVGGREVLGYCYFQAYAEVGYVRNLVVAPGARRSGVGQALLRATGEHLRAIGKTSWRLNVMPDNHAALALYTSVGMRTKYASKSFKLPWQALGALPNGNATPRALSPDRDAALEARFDVPRGQLATARTLGRILLEAVSHAEHVEPEPVGLAVFDPKFPGAFPFRVANLEAVRALLTAMRQHVPNDEHVSLVVESDPPLARLLKEVGASVRHEILHLEGSL